MTTSGSKFTIYGFTYATAAEVAADYSEWWDALPDLERITGSIRVAALLFAINEGGLRMTDAIALADALIEATENRAELEEQRRIERQQG